MEIKILKDKITQKDFEKVAKNFENDKSFRGSIWYRCRRLLIDGYFYESYALFLATWNLLKNSEIKDFMFTIQLLPDVSEIIPISF